ncbi:hypothetical protein Sjap_000442 [Stephania japonica]|uniref:Uncharacterized protein n=1 Tax=Stephania japonica TaxID=461633 RepID=A0AAP0PQR2_9MAGN
MIEPARFSTFLWMSTSSISNQLSTSSRESYNKASGLPERTNEAAGAYAKACISVAEECGLPIIDLWSGMQQLNDWEKSCLSYLHVSFKRGQNLKSLCYIKNREV